MTTDSQPNPLSGCPISGVDEKSLDEMFALLRPEPVDPHVAEVREQINNTFKLSLTLGGLLKFGDWYAARKRYQLAEQARIEAVAEYRRTHSDATDQELFEFGQRVFATETLNHGDVKAWCSIQRLNLKNVDQSFAERRLEILEKKAAQADAAKAVLEEKPLSEEQKMAHIRSIFGLA